MVSKLTKSHRTVALLAAAMMGTTLIAACSSTPTQQSTGEAIDDGVVTARVSKRTSDLTSLEYKGFEVRTDQSGHPAQEERSLTAGRPARRFVARTTSSSPAPCGRSSSSTLPA